MGAIFSKTKLSTCHPARLVSSIEGRAVHTHLAKKKKRRVALESLTEAERTSSFREGEETDSFEAEAKRTQGTKESSHDVQHARTHEVYERPQASAALRLHQQP